MEHPFGKHVTIQGSSPQAVSLLFVVEGFAAYGSKTFHHKNCLRTAVGSEDS